MIIARDLSAIVAALKAYKSVSYASAAEKSKFYYVILTKGFKP
jgi:hypothetical protein